MAFRGLFIGVDRYADSRIPWLAGAGRDAAALHALFTDGVGGALCLLADTAASGAAIRAGLSDLAETAQPEDVVVISFASTCTSRYR